MDKNKLVFYQINPRMFTPQGTLRSAKALLPHIASLGANVAYVFAICKEDDSKDRKFWSKRQKGSKLNNPKNPYRIYDFFSIDEEFGGDEQLKEFVEEAHRLGLYVMLDLVYFHCSPNSKIIQDVPDGVVRNENGEVALGEWNFPKLNFESRALREYLIENMRYFVREYDIDGYRCDSGDKIPFDFWQEAVEEIRKIKPELIMFNEGIRATGVETGVFDFNYNWPVLVPEKLMANPCAYLREVYHRFGNRNKGVWFLENHDTVTDIGRIDVFCSPQMGDCLYAYLFTVDGNPLLYCGEEIADLNEHNMFANKDHNRGYGIDWSNALLPHGKRRFKLIKKLVSLRKTEDVLAYGKMVWLDTADGVLGFYREYNDEKIFVFINFGAKVHVLEEMGEVLLSCRYKNDKLSKNGFVIFKV